MRTRQNGKTIFWGKGFRKTSADFPPAERGLGNECGRDFVSAFFGGGLVKKENLAVHSEISEMKLRG